MVSFQRERLSPRNEKRVRRSAFYSGIPACVSLSLPRSFSFRFGICSRSELVTSQPKSVHRAQVPIFVAPFYGDGSGRGGIDDGNSLMIEALTKLAARPLAGGEVGIGHNDYSWLNDLEQCIS